MASPSHPSTTPRLQALHNPPTPSHTSSTSSTSLLRGPRLLSSIVHASTVHCPRLYSPPLCQCRLLLSPLITLSPAHRSLVAADSFTLRLSDSLSLSRARRHRSLTLSPACRPPLSLSALRSHLSALPLSLLRWCRRLCTPSLRQCRILIRYIR
jgi:hypothetical protein